MFFLNEDFSMRRDAASRLIVFNGDEWKVGAKRFEEDLSTFTAPDFDDVLVHVLIFIFAGTNGNRLPVDLDAVPVPFGICPTRTGIIRRDGKFGDAGIYDREHLPITIYSKEFCVDPAFILSIHPDPTIGIRATNDLYIGAFHQSIEIEIFSAGSIAAT